MQTFTAEKEVLRGLDTWGDKLVLAACGMLAGNYYHTKKTDALCALADVLQEHSKAFLDRQAFNDCLNCAATFLLRAKKFEKVDSMLSQQGLPCDPNVCLAYIKE